MVNEMSKKSNIKFIRHPPAVSKRVLKKWLRQLQLLVLHSIAKNLSV